MKQLKMWLITTALLLGLGMTSSMAAPILSFEAQEQDLVVDASIGDTFTLSLWISGLDNSEDLGGFDIDTQISGSATTNIEGFDFASPLSEFDLLSLTPDNPVNIAGVSFALDLSAQADAFSLLSFDFLISDFGTTVLEVSSAVLSDAFALDLGFTGFSATVNVAQPPTGVNAPASALMFLLLSGALFFRKNR